MIISFPEVMVAIYITDAFLITLINILDNPLPQLFSHAVNTVL